MPRRPSVTKEQVQSHPVLAGGHVVLMSAENPGFPEAATFQGADAMQQSLENQGLEYEPTRGKYGKPESSFIVHINDPAHIEACLGMAKRFGQESVVYSSGGKHQLVWTNGTHEGQATPPSEGHDFYDAEPEDNYTMIPGPNGQPHGFMALHLNFTDPPAPFNPNGGGGGGVAPPEAAQAVVKAAVEAYEDILLGLRMRELAKADEKAAARGPQVHTFKTTARAYDASQTSEDIHDGDILHVPSEGVTGFLMGAWPVAVKHGETGPGSFHQLDPNGPAKGDWKAVDGGKWNPSVELAHKVHAGEHPAPQPGINDTVAGVWQEREAAMKSEKTMKLTDLIKSQVAKAPAANGGAIKVGKAEKKPHYGSWKEAAAANSKRVIGKGTRPSPEESALDEGLSNPMDTEKAEKKAEAFPTSNRDAIKLDQPKKSEKGTGGLKKDEPAPVAVNHGGIDPKSWKVRRPEDVGTVYEVHNAFTPEGLSMAIQNDGGGNWRAWGLGMPEGHPEVEGLGVETEHHHPMSGQFKTPQEAMGALSKPWTSQVHPRNYGGYGDGPEDYEKSEQVLGLLLGAKALKKSEVNVNKGNLKANGGRIAHHSVWKKAEVATAPEANGGAISVGKKELVPAGNRKANGGKIRLGKQEWVIDLKATGHDEKRVIEKDPVKGAKGFEEPKKQDRPEESSATGGSIDTNKPKKGPKQGPAGPDILKPETSPGGKQEAAVSVKGKGDAKGGGTDIFDSVKGKKSPAKDSVIEKADGAPTGLAKGQGVTFGLPIAPGWNIRFHSVGGYPLYDHVSSGAVVSPEGRHEGRPTGRYMRTEFNGYSSVHDTLQDAIEVVRASKVPREQLPAKQQTVDAKASVVNPQQKLLGKFEGSPAAAGAKNAFTQRATKPSSLDAFKAEGTFGREESSSQGEMTSDDEKSCPACGGEAHLGGVLGDRKHFNCGGCGMWFSHKPGSDVAKKEGMGATQAPGAAPAGVKAMSAQPGGTSPGRHGAPKAGVGNKPSLTASEKQDISGVPSAPSSGPAGNTAITSVDTVTKSETALRMATLSKNLEKAFGEFGEAKFGRKSTGVKSRVLGAEVTGEPHAAQVTTAALKKPMGVAAAAAPAAEAGLASPTKPRTPKDDLHAALGWNPAPMKIPVPTPKPSLPFARSELVPSGNRKANGGKMTVGKNERLAEAARWNAEMSPKDAVRERGLELDEPRKVIGKGTKKSEMKKEELCKGCGKLHKAGPCAA